MAFKAVGNVRHAEYHNKRLKAAALISAGVTVCKALRESGYSATTAKGQPSHVVGPIREIVSAEMDRQGLTIPAIVERLHARTYSTTLKNAKDDLGEDITVEMEDSAAQLKAIEIAANFRGLNAPTKHEVDVSGHITLDQVRKEQSRLENALDSWLK